MLNLFLSSQVDGREFGGCSPGRDGKGQGQFAGQFVMIIVGEILFYERSSHLHNLIVLNAELMSDTKSCILRKTQTDDDVACLEV